MTQPINPYVFPIKGDLSRADAVVLSHEAQHAHGSVFEFGLGGSTIFIAGSTSLPFITFEHDEGWTARTRTNLALYQEHLLTEPQIETISYRDQDSLKRKVEGLIQRYKPSLVFIDGEDWGQIGVARPTAFNLVFPLLGVGSRILIHDFRRDLEHNLFSPIFAQHMNSIKAIMPNYRQSNMCLVIKGPEMRHVNWNETEAMDNRVDPASDNLGRVPPSSYFTRVLSKAKSVGVHQGFALGATTGGYLLQQNPHELASLVTFLKHARPRGLGTYVEIGTASGGTLRFLHEELPSERLLSIDDGEHPHAKYRGENLRGIPEGKLSVFYGDSHGEKAREALRDWTLGEAVIDVAFIGDHSKAGLIQDFYLVLPYLKPDALVILHDTAAVSAVAEALTQLLEERLVYVIANFIAPKDTPPAFGITVCGVPA